MAAEREARILELMAQAQRHMDKVKRLEDEGQPEPKPPTRKRR